MRILLVLPLLISISSLEASVARTLSKHAATILHQVRTEVVNAKDHLWHTLGRPTGTMAVIRDQAYPKYCAQEQLLLASMVGRPKVSYELEICIQSLAMLKDMKPVQVVNGSQLFGMNNVLSVDEIGLRAIPKSSWIDFQLLQNLEGMRNRHPFEEWLAQEQCQQFISIEGGTREALKDLVRCQQRLDDLSAAATSLDYAQAGVELLEYVGENSRARTLKKFHKAMQKD